MKIVLYQPEIPQNTGNIIRTCAATGSSLILIGPLGFSVSARHLKRAGLDYHAFVDLQVQDSLEKLLTEHKSANFFFFSSKASKNYTEATYNENDLLIFGSETKGLPEEYFSKWPEHFVKIPMKPNIRCLNLANSVAIALYEAWRQRNFQN